MKLCRSVALVALVAAGTWVPLAATADEPAVTRIDLQQEDLSIRGREVVQVLVEFAPGLHPFQGIRTRARSSSM